MKKPEYLEIRDRILITYPAAFGSLAKPNPLQIGIGDTLTEAIPDTAKRIHFLRWWTGRIEYKISLAHGGSRYSLNGDRHDEITDDHRQKAISHCAYRAFKRMNNPDRGTRAAGAEFLSDSRLEGLVPGIIETSKALAREKSRKKFYKLWPFMDRFTGRILIPS